uniref:Transmembrane BAX inhibitor motif-containing protein 4 n=1 Tax=Caenorhabditis japonica TaxID=281687 RepID=A0A8R1DL87_CAEJA
MAATGQQREPERVNLLADTDDSDDDIKMERSPQMWPINLANSDHAEAGIIDSDGFMPNCVGKANRMIRIAFLRKVLGIVSFQLLFTIGICAAIYSIPNSNQLMQKHAWIVFPNLFGSIALIIALHVYAREVPLNYVLLAAFTAVQAITMGCVVTLFDAKVVLEAAVITGLVVASLFAFTLQNKRDFSVGYAGMGSLLCVLLWAGIFQMFFMSPAMNFAINVFGAGIFCVLLVLDLDMIMYRFSPEDYISACVALYMDILNLFIRILQIVAEANK